MSLTLIVSAWTCLCPGHVSEAPLPYPQHCLDTSLFSALSIGTVHFRHPKQCLGAHLLPSSPLRTDLPHCQHHLDATLILSHLVYQNYACPAPSTAWNLDTSLPPGLFSGAVFAPPSALPRYGSAPRGGGFCFSLGLHTPRGPG